MIFVAGAGGIHCLQEQLSAIFKMDFVAFPHWKSENSPKIHRVGLIREEIAIF